MTPDFFDNIAQTVLQARPTIEPVIRPFVSDGAGDRNAAVFPPTGVQTSSPLSAADGARPKPARPQAEPTDRAASPPPLAPPLAAPGETRPGAMAATFDRETTATSANRSREADTTRTRRPSESANRPTDTPSNQSEKDIAILSPLLIPGFRESEASRLSGMVPDSEAAPSLPSAGDHPEEKSTDSGSLSPAGVPGKMYPRLTATGRLTRLSRSDRPDESDLQPVEPLEHTVLSDQPVMDALGTSADSTKLAPRRSGVGQSTTSPERPVVNVTIGRVEVRADRVQTDTPARKPTGPAMTLDQYLKQRNESKR